MKQIELELGNEKRTFYFGLGFLGNLLEKENLTIQELGSKIVQNPYKWTPLIMFYSLEWGYEKKGETSGVTPLMIADWLDVEGLDSQTVKDFDNALTKSLIKDVPEVKEGKKKVVNKK